MVNPPIPDPSPARGAGSKTKTAIIGIGSPFGNDLAGWDAVDKLAEERWVQEKLQAGSITLLKLDRPGLCLLDYLRGYDHVILIDAVYSPKHSHGMILKLSPDELEQLEKPVSSHGLGVAEALAMGRELGTLPQRMEIWGVVIPQL